MPKLYESIVKLCEEKAISGGKMCNDLSLSRGLMTDLKMGRKNSISSATAMKIANYFGVTVEYLFGGDKQEKPATSDSGGLSDVDKQIMHVWSKLPEHQKKMLLAQIEGLLRMQE